MAAPRVYWHAAGFGSTGTVTVDLGKTADPGHSLVIAYGNPGGVLTGPTPGWTLDLSQSPTPHQFWYRLPLTVGGEQTFDVVNNAAGTPTTWCIWETDQLDPFTPLDESAQTAPFHPATSTTTLSTGSTPGASGTVDTLCLCMHTFYWSTGTTSWSATSSWGSQDGGFTEGEEASVAVGFSYADSAFSSLAADGAAGPFSCTATLTTTVTRNVTNDTFAASLVSYRPPVQGTPWNVGQTTLVG